MPVFVALCCVHALNRTHCRTATVIKCILIGCIAQVLLVCLELLNSILDSSNRTLAMIMGIFGIVQQVLRAFVGDRGIEIAGITILANLGCDAGNRVLLMRSGVLGLVATSIGSASESGSELNAAVCSLLENLVSYKPNLQVVLQESGIISYAVEAMLTYRDDELLQSACCGIMFRLHQGGGLVPWCQHIETESFQVMQLVLAAADRHRTNPELAYSACAVLELFLGEPEMRQLAAGFQAARLVAGMMRQFPQNIDVQESAIGCLCLLAQDERNYELLKEHNCLGESARTTIDLLLTEFVCARACAGCNAKLPSVSASTAVLVFAYCSTRWRRS